MKQLYDSSDNYKLPAIANKTINEKTAIVIKLLLMPVHGFDYIYNPSKITYKYITSSLSILWFLCHSLLKQTDRD